MRSGLQEELLAVLREKIVGTKAGEAARLKAEAACREWVQQKRTIGAWPFDKEPTVRLMTELNSLAVVWPAECREVSNAATI